MTHGSAAVFTDAKCENAIEGLNIMSIQGVLQSRVIDAPVETGTKSFDNKVIDPIKVIVKCVVVMGDENATNAISTVQEMFANRDYNFYSATDGLICWTDLILESCPIIRDVDKYDFINFDLTFKQAMMVQGDSGNGNRQFSKMQNGGYQQGRSVSQ